MLRGTFRALNFKPFFSFFFFRVDDRIAVFFKRIFVTETKRGTSNTDNLDGRKRINRNIKIDFELV